MSLKAWINEENCIGCLKCIRICPTDAIVGAKKMVHTIIPSQCTSCESCINVCPTDCISLATEGEPISEAVEAALTQKKQRRLGAFGFAVTDIQKNNVEMAQAAATPVDRKQQVADAIARAKLRKQQQSS